jgi:hypothetical protein
MIAITFWTLKEQSGQMLRKQLTKDEDEMGR